MDAYKIFVNGHEEGSIKCENIEGYIQKTYPNIKCSISHEYKMVHMSVDILSAMRKALNK